MNYLRLIRFPSLLFIAFVQILMRYCIVDSILAYNSMQLQLSTLNFALLVLSTVLMVGGGYIINDYFDTKADRFNQRVVIVGQGVSRRVAMMLHQVFTGLSVLIAGYVSYQIGHWQFSFLFFMAAGVLWFYSTSYKYYFLIGNVLIAVLAAFIPFLVVMYEVPSLNEHYHQVLLTSKTNFNYLLYWVGTFALFGFLTALIGQFVRDLACTRGDIEIRKKSMPVVVGFKAAKIVIISLIFICCCALFWVWYQYLNAPVDKITPWYFILLLVVPLLILCYKVARYKVGENFTFARYLFRFVLVMGVSYSFVVSHILSKM